MTITSMDNFGHAIGSISMSALRDYYGQTGSVSLNADLNGGTNPVPSSLPASNAETSFSDYRSKNRILKKKGRTYLYDTGTSWSPGESGCVQYNVYVIGGGGSGGASNSYGNIEAPASGGGAGGTAFRRYSVQDDAITTAAISIPSTASAVSRPSSTSQMSGYNGGDVTFNPTGTGATITGTGGFRGFGRYQGNINTTPTATTPVGEAATSGADATGSGQCAKGLGQSGSNGENNYTGGDGPALNIGGNAAGGSGGGSPNFGSGGVNGSTVSGQTTGAPTEPSEFGSLWKINGVDASSPNFQGGNGLSTGGSAGSGGFGAGGGGAGAKNIAVTSGAGGSGCLIVIHYEVNT